MMVVTRALVEERRRTYLGKRVEFVSSAGDDPNPPTPGDQGLVKYVDDMGTLGVKWDSGRTLGILVEDSVRLIS